MDEEIMDETDERARFTPSISSQAPLEPGESPFARYLRPPQEPEVARRSVFEKYLKRYGITLEEFVRQAQDAGSTALLQAVNKGQSRYNKLHKRYLEGLMQKAVYALGHAGQRAIAAVPSALGSTGRVALGTARGLKTGLTTCLLYTSPSPRDRTRSRMPSSA